MKNHLRNPPRYVPTPTAALSHSASSSPRETNITAWLHEIGMGAFTEIFLKEEIDMDVLPFLTENHLVKHLKIPTLGARLRILRHIKNLYSTPPQQSQTPQTPPQQQSPLLLPSQPQQISPSTDSPPSLPRVTKEPLSVSLREVQQLKRELDRRTSELKRLESIVQHLVSIGYAYSSGPFLVPPPPPPPQLVKSRKSVGGRGGMRTSGGKGGGEGVGDGLGPGYKIISKSNGHLNATVYDKTVNGEVYREKAAING